MKTQNLYDILGVTRDAKPRDIKAAYRKKATAAHPDKGGSDEELQAINQAWETLGDPEKRARYDETGEVSGPASTVSPGEMIFLQVLDASLKHIVEQGEGSITTEVSRRLSKQHGKLASQHTAVKELIARIDQQLGRYISRVTGENLIEASLRANHAMLLARSANLDQEIRATLDAITISNGYADSSPEAPMPRFRNRDFVRPDLYELSKLFEYMRGGGS